MQTAPTQPRSSAKRRYREIALRYVDFLGKTTVLCLPPDTNHCFPDHDLVRMFRGALFEESMENREWRFGVTSARLQQPACWG